MSEIDLTEFTTDGRPRFFDDAPGYPNFVIRPGDRITLRGKPGLVETVDVTSRLARLEGAPRTHFVNWEKLVIVQGVDDPDPTPAAEGEAAPAKPARSR